jgi:hypothetical protein
MADEDTVLEEAMDNLKDAGQRIRATHSDMHKDRSACQSQKLMPYSKDLRLTE